MPRLRSQSGSRVEKSTKDYVIIDGKRYNRKRGTPPFEPTEEQRHTIVTLIANGTRIDTIAKCIINPRTGKPVDKTLLYRHFQYEIDNGRALMDLAVTRSLLQKCLGRPAVVLEEEEVTKSGKTKVKKKVVQSAMDPDTNAIKWYEATRMGRKETTIHQNVGADGQPLMPQTVVVLIPDNGRQPTLPSPRAPITINGKANGHAEV